MNIVLIGLKNSGKTTYGARLSEDKNLKFLDLDYLVLQSYNKNYQQKVNKISDVYARLGDARFRDLELSEIVRHKKIAKTVLSTGGGSIITKECLPVLKEIGKIIYLYLSENEFIDRIMGKRSTYLQTMDLPSVYKFRHQLCQKAADHIVNVSERNLEISYNKILTSVS